MRDIDGGTLAELALVGVGVLASMLAALAFLKVVM